MASLKRRGQTGPDHPGLLLLDRSWAVLCLCVEDITRIIGGSHGRKMLTMYQYLE